MNLSRNFLLVVWALAATSGVLIAGLQANMFEIHVLGKVEYAYPTRIILTYLKIVAFELAIVMGVFWYAPRGRRIPLIVLAIFVTLGLLPWSFVVVDGPPAATAHFLSYLLLCLVVWFEALYPSGSNNPLQQN